MRHEFEDEEPYVIVERGSRVAPFIIGAAIGAGLALLFAPKSGAATRRQIKRRAARAADAARDAVTEAADGVKERVGDLRNSVEERIDEAREALQTKKQQVQLAVEAGRAAAHESRADLEVRLAESKAAYRAQSTARPASRRPPRRPTDDA